MMITPYGNAYQRKDGYYQISSGEHKGKLLHCLIYEENYGPIPEGFVVHHIDGLKTNNECNNLMLLSKSNHHKLHMSGSNHPLWNTGKIDKMGGLTFLSAEKNKGKNMVNVSEELGYSSSSTIFHYLDKRGLRWNEI